MATTPVGAIKPGSCNKQKGRQHRHNLKTGKYVRQRVRTEANKKRKLAKYRREHPNWKP